MVGPERYGGAIGYVTPKDKLLGFEVEILTERDRKPEAARDARRQRRELAVDLTLEYLVPRPGASSAGRHTEVGGEARDDPCLCEGTG